jgi:hypothetical protein
MKKLLLSIIQILIKIFNKEPLPQIVSKIPDEENATVESVDTSHPVEEIQEVYVSVQELPVEEFPKSRKTFEEYIKEWGIQHFKFTEFVTLHNRNWKGELYIEPDEDIIENIKDTALVADAIREAWGSGVGINSGWRPLVYNRLVGSTDTSEHVFFKALDLKPSNGKFDEFVKCAEKVVKKMRQEGMNIGFGIYLNSKFIHIDTNADGKRRNRNWVV